MYDSLIYGYGLTLGLIYKLSASLVLLNKQKDILSFNTFFKSFITSKDNSKIYNSFLKYFDITPKIKEQHLLAKQYLLDNYDEIVQNGFERWVSKYLFDQNKDINPNIKFYIYALYNYWAHLFNEIIRDSYKSKEIFTDVSKDIFSILSSNKYIFTTNFDVFLDKYLHPKHIHGKFVIPLKDISQIILNMSEKDFEYTYLFGANGYEKLFRLANISRMSQTKYNLDFFNDQTIQYGNLLIFGMSFCKSELLSIEFLNAYPKYENDFVIRSVDGHILNNLEKIMERNNLSSITFSYHTKEDFEHLHDLISQTKLQPISKFLHSSDILKI